MTQKEQEKLIRKTFASVSAVILICMLLIIGIIVFGHYEKTALYLFNPYQEVLTIQIDAEEYVLKPKQKEVISLSANNYNVKSLLKSRVLLDTTIQITSEVLETGGLVNLSDQPFYLWTTIYGSSHYHITKNLATEHNLEDFRSTSLDEFNMVYIDSIPIYGMVKEYKKNQLVIPREWYFDIKEYITEDIPSSDNSVMETRRASKIFCKSDMLRYWKYDLGMLDNQPESEYDVPILKYEE